MSRQYGHPSGRCGVTAPVLLSFAVIVGCSGVMPVPVAAQEAVVAPGNGANAPDQDPRLVAESERLMEQGRQAERNRDWATAEKAYRACAAFNEKNNRGQGVGAPLHRLAVIKARNRQFAESEALFQKALPHTDGNADFACDYAQMYYDQGRFADCETLLQNSLRPSRESVSRAMPSRETVARTNLLLGYSIAMQPEREIEGLRYLKRALGEAEGFEELAKIYRMRGDLEKATFADEKARVARTRGPHPGSEVPAPNAQAAPNNAPWDAPRDVSQDSTEKRKSLLPRNYSALSDGQSDLLNSGTQEGESAGGGSHNVAAPNGPAVPGTATVAIPAATPTPVVAASPVSDTSSAIAVGPSVGPQPGDSISDGPPSPWAVMGTTPPTKSTEPVAAPGSRNVGPPGAPSIAEPVGTTPVVPTFAVSPPKQDQPVTGPAIASSTAKTEPDRQGAAPSSASFPAAPTGAPTGVLAFSSGNRPGSATFSHDLLAEPTATNQAGSDVSANPKNTADLKTQADSAALSAPANRTAFAKREPGHGDFAGPSLSFPQFVPTRDPSLAEKPVAFAENRPPVSHAPAPPLPPPSTRQVPVPPAYFPLMSQPAPILASDWPNPPSPTPPPPPLSYPHGHTPSAPALQNPENRSFAQTDSLVYPPSVRGMLERVPHSSTSAPSPDQLGSSNALHAARPRLEQDSVIPPLLTDVAATSSPENRGADLVAGSKQSWHDIPTEYDGPMVAGELIQPNLLAGVDTAGAPARQAPGPEGIAPERMLPKPYQPIFEPDPVPVLREAVAETTTQAAPTGAVATQPTPAPQPATTSVATQPSLVPQPAMATITTKPAPVPQPAAVSEEPRIDVAVNAIPKGAVPREKPSERPSVLFYEKRPANPVAAESDSPSSSHQQRSIAHAETDWVPKRAEQAPTPSALPRQETADSDRFVERRSVQPPVLDAPLRSLLTENQSPRFQASPPEQPRVEQPQPEQLRIEQPRTEPLQTAQILPEPSLPELVEPISVASQPVPQPPVKRTIAESRPAVQPRSAPKPPIVQPAPQPPVERTVAESRPAVPPRSAPKPPIVQPAPQPPVERTVAESRPAVPPRTTPKPPAAQPTLPPVPQPPAERTVAESHPVVPPSRVESNVGFDAPYIPGANRSRRGGTESSAGKSPAHSGNVAIRVLSEQDADWNANDIGFSRSGRWNESATTASSDVSPGVSAVAVKQPNRTELRQDPVVASHAQPHENTVPSGAMPAYPNGYYHGYTYPYYTPPYVNSYANNPYVGGYAYPNGGGAIIKEQPAWTSKSGVQWIQERAGFARSGLFEPTPPK